MVEGISQSIITSSIGLFIMLLPLLRKPSGSKLNHYAFNIETKYKAISWKKYRKNKKYFQLLYHNMSIFYSYRPSTVYPSHQHQMLEIFTKVMKKNHNK